MKFLSIFTKTPAHHKFNYVPRYYDPKAEERQERELRIKRELGLIKEEERKDHRSRIAGSFHAARRYRPANASEKTSNLVRFGLLALLTLLLIAYLTWGSNVLYGLLLFIPAYAYFKMRKSRG
jgi:cytochrome c-type biogenesis protein CcmH/NrfG